MLFRFCRSCFVPFREPGRVNVAALLTPGKEAVVCPVCVNGDSGSGSGSQNRPESPIYGSLGNDSF